MCVIASKNKDMLSRIFGILESLDQHNLNESFVRKMRDLAGICSLRCVFCFTEKLGYEGGMLHLPIRGFQSLSVLGSVWWHASPSWHSISCQGLTDPSSLSGESFKSSDVRGGRKHTSFTFDLKNTLFNGAFPVKEKILSKTNGIVLFQEHMKWGWAVQSPDSFRMFWPRYTFGKNNTVCCSR